MNPLPFYVMLLGNPIGFVVVVSLGIYLFAAWFGDPPHVSIFIGLIGIGLTLRAIYSRWLYVQFKRWQRTTEDFAGMAEQRAAEQKNRNRVLLIGSSIAAWCGCIWWVQTHGSSNEWSALATVLWVGISLVWVFVVLRFCFNRIGGTMRRRREVAQHKRERDHVVQSPTSKHHSPTPDDARANVPDYVQDLLKRK